VVVGPVCVVGNACLRCCLVVGRFVGLFVGLCVDLAWLGLPLAGQWVGRRTGDKTRALQLCQF